MWLAVKKKITALSYVINMNRIIISDSTLQCAGKP